MSETQTQKEPVLMQAAAPVITPAFEEIKGLTAFDSLFDTAVKETAARLFI